ncbi:MAG TPA: acetyl ornithine aminotransferase family protein [Verrucomicrobiae bacterium]|jgi:4-aminobutyrate aminotransferase|nr:acetyl ornithine aminotransferase family protein [Verrucomicrobiae bacterium]
MSKFTKPKIKTSLPGPNARKLLKRDAAVVSPSYTRSYPLVADKGRGMWITDTDGNRFLDFTAGIAVTSTGHCHPRVVKALQKQAARLIHMSGTDFYYEAQVKLAEKLGALTPGKGVKKVFFTNSGTESVEAAFKLARYKTGREKMIAFFGAFHGRTMGALSLTGSKIIQKQKFGPLVPGVTHVEYPYFYRNCKHQDPLKYGEECVRYIEEVLFKKTIPPSEVAAIIVEPVQGEGGYVVPPPTFHPKLRELTRKYGILLIADEVQSGMGRTGKMFAIEHWNVEPDIITVAKGIASGMPLGAIIARGEVMDWEPGAHANTFGGNPLACVAALETIDLLETKLLKNSEVVGKYLLAGLESLSRRFLSIGDARGLGLMCAIEIVKNRATKEPAPALRDRIVQGAFEKGLLLLPCGETSIRFSPPLIASKKDVDVALEILEGVFSRL